MINANELRIGNYIEHLGNISPCTASTIYAVSQVVQPSVMYKPIPLTEELMLRLGFENCWFSAPDSDGVFRNKKEQNKDYFLHPLLSDKIVYYLPYFDMSYYIGSVTIKYIHQLQNLYFALTGTELTLDTYKTKHND